MITSAQQPFCRCCGRALKKRTELHVFGIPEGTPPSAWGSYGVPHPEEPATRAEAQRYINQKIVSSKKGYKDHLVVAVWDGESYDSSEEFFCTLRCAAAYGRFAVIHEPELQTQNYADAIRRHVPAR